MLQILWSSFLNSASLHSQFKMQLGPAGRDDSRLFVDGGGWEWVGFDFLTNFRRLDSLAEPYDGALFVLASTEFHLKGEKRCQESEECLGTSAY